MAAHSAPSARRQLRTTALTAIATALAVVGLMFVGSALTTSSPGREPAAAGTTTGPVALLDAPAAPSPSSSTPPAVRKIEAPRTTTKPAPTSTRKPTTTTSRTSRTTTARADD